MAPRLAFLISKLVCDFCAGAGRTATTQTQMVPALGLFQRRDDFRDCPVCNGSGVNAMITDKME